MLNELVERTTVDGHVNFQGGAKNEIGFKSAVSWFDRSLKYGDFDFSGKQVSSYSEVNRVWREEKHILVVGANLNTDQFQKTSGDIVHFHDYNFTTVGLFAQDDWRVSKKFTLTAGARVDNNSRYKWFVLPQAGFFINLRITYQFVCIMEVDTKFQACSM